MADYDANQLALMRLLAMKHFPLKTPRPKVGIPKLTEALKRLGTDLPVDLVFEILCNLKGRGIANTEPKIIMKEEMHTAQFEVWLTPLGRTELERLS